MHAWPKNGHFAVRGHSGDDHLDFYVFLAGAPIVLRGYGVGPQSIGWYIMSVPLAYIVGNYLTSHLIHRLGERKMMMLGQAATVGGLC